MGIPRLADGRFNDPAYQYCYTQAELEQLLETAGLDVVKNSKVHFGFIWNLMVVSAIATNDAISRI